MPIDILSVFHSNYFKPTNVVKVNLSSDLLAHKHKPLNARVNYWHGFKTEIENLKLFNNVHSDFAQYFIYSTIEFEVEYFTMDRK